MNQGPSSFLHDIPSIHQKYPAIPAMVGGFDLDHHIAAGDPLDYEHVKHAAALAKGLQAYRGLGVLPITHEMVTTAASRAVAVETAYAAAEYFPLDIFQELQQIYHRLGIIEDNFKINSAQIANLRAINHNMQLQTPLQLLPLQKSVVGYGHHLAVPLINILDAAGQQAFHLQFPANGIAAVIGTTPPNFNSSLETYGHIDILSMIVFYNESFTIIAQDDLPERINKFRRFLSEF